MFPFKFETEAGDAAVQVGRIVSITPAEVGSTIGYLYDDGHGIVSTFRSTEDSQTLIHRWKQLANELL